MPIACRLPTLPGPSAVIAGRPCLPSRARPCLPTGRARRSRCLGACHATSDHRSERDPPSRTTIQYLPAAVLQWAGVRTCLSGSVSQLPGPLSQLKCLQCLHGPVWCQLLGLVSQIPGPVSQLPDPVSNDLDPVSRNPDPSSQLPSILAQTVSMTACPMACPWTAYAVLDWLRVVTVMVLSMPAFYTDPPPPVIRCVLLWCLCAVGFVYGGMSGFE